MADLQVDLGLLQETAGALGMLIHEFSDADKIEADNADAVGAKELVDSLHSFATNWKSHRGDLLQSMQAVHDMAAKSHQTYVDTDDRLAQDIQRALETPQERRIGGAQ